MELTLTGAEGAERSFDAVGAGWARLRDQSSLGNGGWEEAVSGCGGLEEGMRDAAEKAEAGGGHVGGALEGGGGVPEERSPRRKRKVKKCCQSYGPGSTAQSPPEQRWTHLEEKG